MHDTLFVVLIMSDSVKADSIFFAEIILYTVAANAILNSLVCNHSTRFKVLRSVILDEYEFLVRHNNAEIEAQR